MLIAEHESHVIDHFIKLTMTNRILIVPSCIIWGWYLNISNSQNCIWL